ncbi:hypothetical protein [Azospirillum doebereinerae]
MGEAAGDPRTPSVAGLPRRRQRAGRSGAALSLPFGQIRSGVARIGAALLFWGDRGNTVGRTNHGYRR